MSGSQWPGLVTNASPFAIPPTAAVEQVNLVGHVPGQVSVRGGMRKVATADGSPEVLDCFPLEVDGKPALVGMRADGSLALLSSPSYGWASQVPYEPDLSSPALLSTSYTYRYIGAGEDTGDHHDPDTDGDTNTCSSTLDGGSSADLTFGYSLDAEECEATTGDYIFDGGSARSVAACDTVVTDNLCGEDVVGAGVPSAPRNVVAVFSGSDAALSWDSPASDGGSPIIDYQYEVSTDGGGTPSPLPGQLDPPLVLQWQSSGVKLLVWRSSSPIPAGWILELEAQASTNGGTTWTGV